MKDQIGNPYAAARGKQPIEFLEYLKPIVIVSQVVQDRGGQDHIVRGVCYWSVAKIRLNSPDRARCDLLHTRSCAFEHRHTEVKQVCIEVPAGELPQPKGVVASAASDVEHATNGICARTRCLCDERHRQRRVESCRLASLEHREPVDVFVETLPDLIHGGFL